MIRAPVPGDAVDRSTGDAVATLVEANNGVFGGCSCIGFHAEHRWVVTKVVD